MRVRRRSKRSLRRYVASVQSLLTPASGAPVITFLSDAAKCASASYASVETEVEDDADLGMVVWSPEIYNDCNGPVDASERTLEIYATEDRTGAPVLTAVRPGLVRIGGTAGEDACGGRALPMPQKSRSGLLTIGGLRRFEVVLEFARFGHDGQAGPA